MEIHQTTSVAERIALTLAGLARVVAERGVRGRFGEALATALVTFIWRRVRRVEVGIQALLARFRAGTLRGGTLSGGTRPTRKAAGVRGAAGAATGAGPRVPRRLGWLLPLIPAEAANLASQLRVSLADPEMVALLARSAQARRLMAPLCRMLGIEADLLAPAVATPTGVMSPGVMSPGVTRAACVRPEGEVVAWVRPWSPGGAVAVAAASPGLAGAASGGAPRMPSA